MHCHPVQSLPAAMLTQLFESYLLVAHSGAGAGAGAGVGVGVGAGVWAHGHPMGLVTPISISPTALVRHGIVERYCQLSVWSDAAGAQHLPLLPASVLYMQQAVHDTSMDPAY